MAKLSGNNCTIITIIPMEVECKVTNVTSPFATNGSAEILINGGTPPYSITWDTGTQGNVITNLSVGSYSATVTDYYGDYIITTTCVVASNTEIVYQFNGCNSNIGETIYVSGSTYDPPFPNLNPFIQFNEISGCYEFISQINNLGLTYSALTVSNAYESCEVCDPPTPTPLPQDNLCLSNGIIQYDFTTNGTDANGNYQWINTANGMVMTYNVITLRWEITPWTNVGIATMVSAQSSPSVQPLGAWVNLGNTNPGRNWLVTVGVCTGIPLTLTVNSIDPLCQGEDGSVIMVGSGGVPPYMYQIQGITAQQNSGVFNNVLTGNYVGTVQDSDTPNSTNTFNFTIGTGLPLTNYQLSLTSIPTIGTTQTDNSLTNSYTYGISVSPALPIGVSISFNLKLRHTKTIQSPMDGNSVLFNYDFDGYLNGIPIVMSSTTQNSIPNSPGCESTNIGQIITFTTNSSQITIDSTSVVTGELTETVDLNDLSRNCNCPTVGEYRTILQATNISVTGDCAEIIKTDSNEIALTVTMSDCDSTAQS